MGDVRLVLTDEVWADMAEVWAQGKRKGGRPPEQSDRMFLEAVLSLARTGVPWRELPGELGHWAAVYKRFRRWEKRGVWRQWWAGVQQDRGKLAKQVLIESTIGRAHQHAAGAFKNTVGKRPRRWAVLGEACPRRCTADALMSGQAERS